MKRVEAIIDEHFEKSSLKMNVGSNHVARNIAKIATWCLDIQNHCGLVIHRDYRVLRISQEKTGDARAVLVLPYRFAEPVIVALGLVIRLINTLAAGKVNPADINSLISKAKASITQFRELGQNVPDLLNAAITKNIPFRRIQGQVYRFGYGAAQRILESTFTDKTSAIGVRLCGNKALTAQILRESGFPGGAPVKVVSSDDAVAAADRIGYPVVVKPVDTEGGRGVSANLLTADDLIHAYELASKISPNIIVDRHVDGTGHRFTVMFGKVVKVTAKAPWGVRGDGISTISELVEREPLKQPPMSEQHSVSISACFLDDEAMSLLRQYRLTPESVLSQDSFVPLRRRNNATAGGSTTLLDFDQVHKDNLELALRIADLFLLDVAGIDLIIPDVSRSWMEQDCLVCDVNSKPQTGMTAAAAFLDSVMSGKGGRVPATLVLFSGDHSPIHHGHLQDLLKQLNVNSISAREGIWINGKQIGRPGLNGFNTAKIMLSQRDVHHAAIVISVEDLMSYGLPCDRLQNLIIVRSSSSPSEHLGLQWYEAGKALRKAVESHLIQVGLIPTHLEASSLMEKIWPHLIGDL